MKTALVSIVMASMLASSVPARAEEPAAPPTEAIPPATGTPPPAAGAPAEPPVGAPTDAPTPLPTTPTADPEEVAKWQRAQFSGKRWVLEMLAGATLGTLAAIGVYQAAGEGTGGALAGIAAGFVVTPLVEYGVGRAMGGRGSLGYTYLGGLIGFSAATPATQGSEAVVLVVAQILCPITSGLFFEFTSGMRARQWAMQHGVTLTVAPVRPEMGDGAIVGLGMRW